MMIKSSALYVVIVIALVIGILCSSLIVSAYYYRAQYQRKFRYDQLQNNLGSAINILLASTDSAYTKEKAFSLFNRDADSVSLKRLNWGVFDIGIARAFIQADTLFKTFSIANTIDSSKWAVLYLMDEDRPLSISGKTSIKGTAYIPKAGVKAVFVDGKSYTGVNQLISGNIHYSERRLPKLSEKRLGDLLFYGDQKSRAGKGFTKTDSVDRSFLLPTLYFNFKKNVTTLKNIKIKGNIVVLSDTTLVVDSTAVLTNTIVFAKSILVKSGFHGNCQLFALDSIGVDRNCKFSYPSSLGLLNSHDFSINNQRKIRLGENADFSGVVFTALSDSAISPTIIIEKNAIVSGQIHSLGTLQLNNGTQINGSVFVGRFLFQNSFFSYENYVVNSTLDSKLLSNYYLTSDLFPVASKNKNILQWLEGN